jgi:hypothetical protein
MVPFLNLVGDANVLGQQLDSQLRYLKCQEIRMFMSLTRFPISSQHKDTAPPDAAQSMTV